MSQMAPAQRDWFHAQVSRRVASLRTATVVAQQKPLRIDIPEGGWESEEELAAALVKIGTQVADDIVRVLDPMVQRFKGKWVGLQYKLKAEDKVASKLRRKNVFQSIKDPQAQADRLTDIVRYTVVFDDDIMTSALTKLLYHAESSNHMVIEEDNKWLRTDDYSGLHFLLQEPRFNVAYELQCHSEDSFALKQGGSHGIYELIREPDLSDEDRMKVIEHLTDYVRQGRIGGRDIAEMAEYIVGLAKADLRREAPRLKEILALWWSMVPLPPEAQEFAGVGDVKIDPSLRPHEDHGYVNPARGY